MKLTGKLKSVSMDWLNNKWNILLELNEKPSEEINEIAAYENLNIELKKYRKPRSLNANSYFHVLNDKLADKLRNSKPYQKNYLIQQYGQKELDEKGNQIVLWVDEKVKMLERSDIHCEVLGYNKNYVKYGVLKPTHLYTSDEMAILIDGTVQDAKEQGIETFPPKMLDKMVKTWKEHKA